MSPESCQAGAGLLQGHVAGQADLTHAMTSKAWVLSAEGPNTHQHGALARPLPGETTRKHLRGVRAEAVLSRGVNEI